MNVIKVDRNELLAVLRTNRETHLKDYQEAQAEYRKLVVQELTEMLKQAKARDGKIVRNLKAPEPQSFVASYDTAIRMLEMSVEEVIELTQGEFQQYVEDQWTWRNSFATTTMVYKKG